VVLPHRAYLKNQRRWFDLCNQLAAANISYRLLLAGDELVDHPLTTDALDGCRALLILERGDLLRADRELLEKHLAGRRAFRTAAEVVANVKPAVQTKAAKTVRALPRVAAGSAVVHLLNYAYDPARDDVTPLKDVEVRLDLAALGVPHATSCKFFAPDAEPLSLTIDHGAVTVPSLGLWGLLVIGAKP
jgi:hypothetical protein